MMMMMMVVMVVVGTVLMLVNEAWDVGRGWDRMRHGGLVRDVGRRGRGGR